MTYDQEKTYLKCNCIEYDAPDMLQVLLDCAFEPRSALAASIGRAKNKKMQQLTNQMAEIDPFSDTTEMLMRTAYGEKTLGMPRIGIEGNVDNIDADLVQKFVNDNLTPEKCVLVASGIRDHKEFVDLAKSLIPEDFPQSKEVPEREPA